MKSVTILRGDSWSYTGVAETETAIDLTGWTITSNLVDTQSVVLNFTTTWVANKVNTFTHKATSASTARVPEGSYICNVKFTSPTGGTMTSESLQVIVKRGIS